MDLTLTEGFEVDILYSRYMGQLRELTASAQEISGGSFNYVMIRIDIALHARFFFIRQEDATAFALKWL